MIPASLPRFAYPCSPAAILEMLDVHRALVIENFPMSDSQDELIRWAESLGKLSTHGIGKKSNVEGGFVHLVQPLKEPRQDAYGNIVRSTTRVEMACHTDDYFSQYPIDTMALLCCEEDAAVESHIAWLPAVLAVLPAHHTGVLRRAIFPTPFGHVPILTTIERETVIRYDGYEMGKMIASRCYILEKDGEAAIDALQKSLREAAERIVLRRGQCLVLDNHRVLHGRSAIPEGSGRLLKRIRFHRHAAIRSPF